MRLGDNMGGTNQVKEKKLGWMNGINDAIFIRNKYQTELDNSWLSIVKIIHYLEDQNKWLKGTFSQINATKKNIEAHLDERTRLYSSLENLLKKETEFEERMWKTTQKGRKVKSITFKQKFKDSDIEEAKYDSMMEYLKQYPEYASKSSFRNITQKIESKEAEIRKSIEEYNNSISSYNFRLSYFQKDIQKAEDKFVAYEKIMEEGVKKLSETWYWKHFRKFASEKEKSNTEINTLNHRPDQFRNTLDIIKKEHLSYQTKPFQEIEH